MHYVSVLDLTANMAKDRCCGGAAAKNASGPPNVSDDLDLDSTVEP